ncbi:MAG: NAD(P)-dependent oxidoreductase [Proteobacteria bacterium]|jgi:citronellol/citronellal dehydrogenase|uniref:Short-chain dehydrogenase n=1 Tax=SAR92 bacterium BACL26 MAG-121220-bin70 TaxID=1655626 RepID=A0A0R2UFX6_9GAMM|nr:MAG: short-chain dehydrogenase [SAR92 bacterium BACL26 MAG-121220-bin70]MDA0794984.1 NAD(P)-dependent oxidoreductase [Pseudomonadota bacterium]MDA1350857.1 NAD(P)-dependent oxidoreductase [Pseudomonadota bacterium]|tara:strand:- start:1834 stop:2664 length:831 start_codon:yes stop_codon:yes gene_type:complete
MADLSGKTLFISGASRGIGLAIARRAAADGANIAIAAKTAEPHPKLSGTIYTAAEEIRKAGGQALPLLVDVRYEDQVEAAMEKTAAEFGGIDILINNASAINLASTESVSMKAYDLMHNVNTRGTFLCSQKAVPYLRRAENPHVLNLSPPLNMEIRWFQNHVAYSMAKYGMSMCVLGMSSEFKRDGIAFNALWPRTAIATAAVANHLGGDMMMVRSRTVEIMADAAHIVLTRNSREFTGNFYIDDDVLASEGVTDLNHYQVDPALDITELLPDFFV